MHPDGRLARLAVIGSACPAGFASEPADDPSDALDGVIFAPAAAEWRRPEGLGVDLRAATARLTPDGFVYVLVQPRRRRRARRLLRESGLRVTDRLIHVPQLTAARYLVPLEEGAGTYAFSTLVAPWPRRRLLVSSLIRFRLGRMVLARALAPVALVARGPRGRPLYEWLAPDDATEPPRVITVRRGRGSDDRVTLLVFRRGSREPAQVVKLGVDGDAGRNALARLGSAARNAGADVPSFTAPPRRAPGPSVAETPIAGRTAAAALARRPRMLPDVLERLADWLERWNLETRIRVDAPAPLLEEQVLLPLRAVAPVVGRDYVDRLARKTEALTGAGSRLCKVAAHNDLTMFNVLLGRGGRLGIVDWEAARGDCLPLTDLPYAAVDAVAATAHYRDRVAAFEAVYGGRGDHHERIRVLTQRVASGLELTPDVVDLAFHACWLQHAADEISEHGLETEGPFVQIVRRLAHTGDDR